MEDFGDAADFRTLLEYVRSNRGFDFTGYKQPSLMRRVTRRMQTVGITSFSNYTDYLEVHPDEFQHLFNTLLINVTAFFRDSAIWEALRTEVIPAILRAKADTDPIRIWSAGCASGEETYSVAMVLAELLGIEQFQARVKIYATDLDEDALTEARQATYSRHKIDGLSETQLRTFFDRKDEIYTFSKELRRMVIFGRHDLVQDAPISKIDLLLCRNTLMYFNAETQGRILTRFHFALNDNGYLFLGKAEMLLTHSDLFSPVQLKGRVFTKVPRLTGRDRLLIMAQTGHEASPDNLPDQLRLLETAFDIGPVARIVLKHNGVLALANQRVRGLFSLSPQDIGRPLQDLELSYRPVELRSCLEEAYERRRPITLSDVAWQNSRGEALFLEVQIIPLFSRDNAILGASISFVDITQFKRLQAELEHANQELEMAYEELQSTNEELETTNEELQSTNEELETTNEELQSTNEELETMNEELQSANEELQTLNEELQRSSSDLNKSNTFLECVFASLKGGVAVVNRDLQVQIWNTKAEDLWGLRPEEVVGQYFLNLDIGLPVEQLRQPIRDCLTSAAVGSVELTVEAVNRKGRSLSCHITCTPLVNTKKQVQGVILIME
ncbi:PAS domain-containing protein [Phormidium sp. FACHB-322]|nr:CheR family methyltransferase [Leptolyngbya sp. FACHB-60]MBD1919018.1 PAS domain-containing protein [Phormidium sp. FACHB-77]MBD2031980.1 PAS domain-containing protein [Phormidium sp. FACHB-322]MBD2053943.1 PAS domain-containing protein [Leptolyngbya sp. FACHB-60]